MIRVGTWNLAGRWSAGHQRFLEDAACDVWLLTEVPAAFSLGVGDVVRSQVTGTRGRSWAAVWSAEPLVDLTSPHEAAALARRGGTVFCSCVLPWRGARATWPDDGANIAEMTRVALERMAPDLRAARDALVWGGDWNHAMKGREYAGSAAGRTAITGLLEELEFTVATSDAPHRIDGLLSIDHIAVPTAWPTGRCERLVATAEERRLSDHDAYVVSLSPS